MRNEKILVVEFEENSLNTLLQTLNTEGFQVVTAKDGHEGLLMFESEKPDLVILEPMLLKLHGFDLCRKISKDSKKNTPVIITTGFYKGEHYKSEAIDTFGAAAFFEKPYKDEDLLLTIHELLGNGTSESVKEIKTSVQEKKAASFDIEESVREMERSIREKVPSPADGGQKSIETEKNAKKPGLSAEVDEMLQDALSDFGLNIDEKPAEIKVEKKQKKEEVKKEKPSVAQKEAQEQEKTKEKESVQPAEKRVEPQDEPPNVEKELKTEELIEELIQKEEKIEEKEKHDVEAVEKEPEEKIEVKEDGTKKKIKEKGEEPDQKIFEDYFEEPEKTSSPKKFFGFFKKIRKSLPLMIGSTAFVVLVAAGATYYFLKPNKPQTPSDPKSNQSISNVERSTSAMGDLDPSSAPLTQDGSDQGETLGGPALEGVEGDPAENTTPKDETSDTEMEPESTTEFMSTTGLSSNQRQVMLLDGAPAPESRQFEIIEVEETGAEKLGESQVETSSPELKEALQNIIQSENTSERIKTGDLVPIESVDVPPVATKKVNPRYPPAAFQQGIEDTVVFRALISEFGNVLDVAFVNPSKTAPAFKKVCDEAVRKWRFSPAKKGGVNVKVWKTFSIAFKKNITE